MTSKELRRLKRGELLQLLLAQSEETEQTSQTLKETQAELELTAANYERLRKRLDMKDAQIAELKAEIERQRTKREIELADAGNIAEAALRLNGVFEAAQKAAEQYLYNMQVRQQELDAREAELSAREAALNPPAEPEEGPAEETASEEAPAAAEEETPEEQPSAETAETPAEPVDLPADSGEAAS